MTRRFSLGRLAAWTVLIAFLVLTIAPFYWMIRTALTPAADTGPRAPPGAPEQRSTFCGTP
jgi:ABC-type glycerol-3-phosphate transport system permease component